MRKITKKDKFLRFIALCFGFFSLSFGSIFDSELDCSLLKGVKEFEGHYYGISDYTMGYEEALLLTENSNAYLAIPDSKAENEFLSSLLTDNGLKTAFIGIYDSSYIANYCYDNAKCVFDDARFRTALNKPIYFKNWAANEPNNKVDENDKSEADFSKFKGEHYVVLQSNGKWADVGFKDRHNAIFEFDEAPSCFNQNTGGQE